MFADRRPPDRQLARQHADGDGTLPEQLEDSPPNRLAQRIKDAVAGVGAFTGVGGRSGHA
jgi:hypothetical protein